MFVDRDFLWQFVFVVVGHEYRIAVFVDRDFVWQFVFVVVEVDLLFLAWRNHFASHDRLGFLRRCGTEDDLAVLDHVRADDLGLATRLPFACFRARLNVVLVRHLPAVDQLLLHRVDAGEALIHSELVGQVLLGLFLVLGPPDDNSVLNHVRADNVG